ncbi:carboxy-S-adenosyl-L-methionine synthase CmoA [Gammaproteobacteria bacterium 45_16_T64]|nr:carboxy-S-adenosyl-L-methionine synthase CmoA [Gammaproteobacteria bacterium 45_16_T64]
MTKDPSKDRLFQEHQTHLVDFAFDEQVVNVFPDMIRRSVPGYETVISMLGVFAGRYVQPNSTVYDLGCSLGAATLALRRHISVADCQVVGVDNSTAMIHQCQQNIEQADQHGAGVPVSLICDDIQNVDIHNGSLVALNFTLQFLDPAERLGMLTNIYNGLLPGGVLVVSEKICFDEQSKQEQFTDLHHDFKRANGYSDLEISQKRQTIENVLVPDTLDEHVERLQQAGFSTIQCWFQCFNFISIYAIK